MKRRMTADYTDCADKPLSSSASAAKSEVKKCGILDMADWSQTTLGKLCVQRGQSVNPLKSPEQRFELYSVPSFAGGKPEILLGNEIGSSKQLVTPQTVLLCKINPRINRAWIVGDFTPHTKIASTEWIVFPPSGTVEPAYLCYFLQQTGVRDFLASNVSGVGGSLMRVKPSTIRDFPFVYPARERQRRIVEEIEEQFTRLEAGVAALKRVQANLKRYRASVLKAACEGRLVPTEAELSKTADYADGTDNESGSSAPSAKSAVKYEPAEVLLQRILKERRAQWEQRQKTTGKKPKPYREPQQPDTTDLPALPEGWTWARLEQLGFTFGGLTKNPKRTKLVKRLPYLRVANVYANELRLDDVEEIGVEDADIQKLLLSAGDLLVVEGNGSKDQIGRLAIWDGSIDPCLHQNHVIKVRLVLTRIAKWILHWLLSPGGRHYVELVASSTSGLYTLSVNKVGDLPIVAPPFAEQERIVAEVERRLSVVDELEDLATANFKRADRLRQAILQKAFSGRLVPQDPNDVPAAPVLEPIGATAERGNR